MTASIIIPTLYRPVDLRRCLSAVANQTLTPNQIVVVVRDIDKESALVVESLFETVHGLQLIEVNETGQVAALNKGLDAAQADIIAIIDDDTAPRRDWLEKIVRYFQECPSVAGVGGRDWQWYDGVVNGANEPATGVVQWFGRIIGNHHLGHGPARDVDILKGANMSFRRSCIGDLRFDRRLLGSGAQVHNDLGFSLSLRRKGMKLIYDPSVAVDHFPAVRADGDVNHRGGFNGLSLRDAVHNETLVVCEYLPPIGRAGFIVWSLAVGTGEVPGLVQVVWMLICGKKRVLERWRWAIRGRFAGWKSFRTSRQCARRVMA